MKKTDYPVFILTEIYKYTNNRIEDSLPLAARSFNFDFRYIRETDTFISLKERIVKANTMKPDLLVSIHATFQTDYTQNGYEIFYSKENMQAEKYFELAEKMRSKLDESVFPGIIIKESGFLILRNTTSPAILIELGNLKNKIQYEFISDAVNQEAIATALNNAIIASLSK